MTAPAQPTGAVDRLLERFRERIEEALAAGYDVEVRVQASAVIRRGALQDCHVEPAREYPLRDAPASR